MRAAVLHEHRRPFAIEEVDLAPPGQGEVEVRLHASGVCRSDWSTVTGDTPSPLPAVLGHEGGGRRRAGRPRRRHGRAGRPRRALVAPLLRALPALHERAPDAVRRRGACAARRHAPRWNDAPLARRPPGAPLIVPLDVRRPHRRPRRRAASGSAGTRRSGSPPWSVARSRRASARREPRPACARILARRVRRRRRRSTGCAGRRSREPAPSSPSTRPRARRALALDLGAAHAVDPGDGDPAEAVRELTGGCGADSPSSRQARPARPPLRSGRFAAAARWCASGSHRPVRRSSSQARSSSATRRPSWAASTARAGPTPTCRC